MKRTDGVIPNSVNGAFERGGVLECVCVCVFKTRCPEFLSRSLEDIYLYFSVIEVFTGVY